MGCPCDCYAGSLLVPVRWRPLPIRWQRLLLMVGVTVDLGGCLLPSVDVHLGETLLGVGAAKGVES